MTKTLNALSAALTSTDCQNMQDAHMHAKGYDRINEMS